MIANAGSHKTVYYIIFLIDTIYYFPTFGKHICIIKSEGDTKIMIYVLKLFRNLDGNLPVFVLLTNFKFISKN